MSNPFDRYENLPGVKVEYENGNLYSEQQNINASTKSILILGTAIDGPVGEPISVRAIGGPKAAERLFGGLLQKEELETGEINPENGEPVKATVRTPHQGTLVRSMYEALDAGNEDVRLLRVSGRRAKTELPVHDTDRELEQTLGAAAGNSSFSEEIKFSDSGRLSTSPIQHIRETKEDGSLVREFSGATAIANTVMSVDSTPGNEAIFFRPNVFRPGNKIEVSYNFNQRDYHEVQHTDPAGELTQDPENSSYFASQHGFFSDDIAAGHTINVFLNGTAVTQVNTQGHYMYRPGKGDPAITNEREDEYSALEYEQGGIRFTDAFFEAVANGSYDELDGAEVFADYFYYNETAITETNIYDVLGQDTPYELDYLPKQDEFSISYNIGDQKYTLEPKTSDNPNGDYSMVFPNTGSEKTKVIIKPGAAPVGVQLKAFYTTSQTTNVNPKIIVEAAYAGKEYGGLEDIMDPSSNFGVAVDVRVDLESGDPAGREKVIYFIKPANKRLSNRDEVLEYKTRELRGIRTINEFANYVNNDPANNIVRLLVEEGGTSPLQGIVPTNRAVYLGEKFNDATDVYETYIDETKASDDPNRFLWTGNNGFFNQSDMASMSDLYDTLGGLYEATHGAMDDAELISQGIYSKLENYPVDSIVLAEANINTPIGRVSYDSTGNTVMVEDPYKNFGTQLAQHCATATARVWETIGFIGVEPVKNAGLIDIQNYIDEVTSSNINTHFMYNAGTHEHVLNEDGDPIDVGHYLNVVFGPEVGLFNDKIGNYIANGATVYAALNSVLDPELATTNKEIPIRGLRYNLSESQHNQLAGARFVTFEDKVNPNGSRNYKVKDGTTAGQPGSDYERLSTVNITHATVQLIRIKADPFIGLPNGLVQRNSLATEIQAGLDKLKENGVLQDFKFSIFTSAREKVLGNAFITLELVPEFETRRIYTSVALRQSL